VCGRERGRARPGPFQRLRRGERGWNEQRDARDGLARRVHFFWTFLLDLFFFFSEKKPPFFYFGVF
jgi:hypothetical protein